MRPYAINLMYEHSFSNIVRKLDMAGHTLHLDGNISGIKMAERAERESRPGGKALIFRRDIPIVMNLFSSVTRMEVALKEPIHKYNPEAKLPELEFMSADKYKDISLSDLPIMKHCEDDVSGSINMGCVISENEGIYNSGIYRIQPLSDSEAIIHCYPESDLAEQLSKGDDIPVTIAVGTSFQLILASVSKLPSEIDELKLASHIAVKGMKYIKTDRHPVPYGTQIIIQGTVSASEKRKEGPFLIHTGEMSPVEDYPLLRVESVKMVIGGYYHTLVTGPNQEESKALLDAARQFISK
jgi:3-polyprenyl-4-hydroxybenzoate decarboxylase